MAIPVNVLPVSAGIHGFTAAYAPQQHPANHAYVLQSLADISQNVFHRLGSMGQAMFAQAQNLFQQYDGHEIMEQARVVLREVAGTSGADVIYFMSELHQLQSAQSVMQNYIMANPIIANMYLQQRCDGYSGSYYNHYEGLSIYENPFYISATNGILMKPDERSDPETELVAYTYFVDENEYRPSTEEQFDIMNTYMVVEQQVKWGNDPTDILDNQL